MREIKQLNESHIDAYTDIAFNAYPSFKNFNKDAMDKYKLEAIETMNNDPVVTFYGLFEHEELIGVMRLFDFQMNLFGKIMPVSGLGFLGVHLLHKKNGVARELIAYYEKHYLNKEVPIALLLPFRPDFYKRMGYGFGTKLNQYRIPSKYLPKYEIKDKLRYLVENDLNIILECHEKVVKKSHGRIKKFGDEIRDLFGNAFNRIIGSFNKDGKLNGYLVYKFDNGKPGNYTINHIYIKELIYENSMVLKNLMGYLKNQIDQVELVIFNTTDEHFHNVFSNPLNDSKNYIPYGYLETNTQAIGVMYKILDIKMAFAQCSRHYNYVNLKVRFLVEDDYNSSLTEIIVHFNNGEIILDELEYDVSVKMKYSDFSSLFLACTSVSGLYNIGLLEIDNKEKLEILDLAFYYPQKPVCYTDF
ncbi:GNAT family N-acetyltransferase [Clostridiaceae bacterium HSG29]|nr:GNAT family N-acetyltransferase [Clostridiaceae bacterium HSG29]